jgi:hypothetical protein
LHPLRQGAEARLDGPGVDPEADRERAMTSEELEDLARRLAGLLNAGQDLPMMVTADELADYLRTSADKIRANPARWGGIKLGDGEKAHYRFPLDRDKLAEWAVRPAEAAPPKPQRRRPRSPRPKGPAPLIEYDVER